ncbi:MAG: hypothetical protein AVDCRST_MAG02-4112 [uncultured Rubrobacteraceae bacterium]|uniref:ABC transporter Uup C-terminal domain-containing protein n=1 Tax=uncultured Rubrobacteraceae bacterium TaxID=349277 RepID=A0A6J4RV18_9ACTN|nr:MAG: hypothetical protein AVDCRST_MAG02-4112 [uncultured Rubrobacteraceae bacterium]
MEREGPEVRAGKKRRMALAEEIRKAELVRDRLRGVEEIARSYPEGHEMRARLDNLHLERMIETVEEELADLWDRTLHPRGT